jgi:hypothetical protein
MERDRLHRAVMHKGHALRAILLSHVFAVKFMKIEEKKNNSILKMSNVSQTSSFIYTWRWLMLSRFSINHFVLWHEILFFINLKIMKWIKGFWSTTKIICCHYSIIFAHCMVRSIFNINLFFMNK